MNLFGKTIVSLAVLAAFGGANAAQNGRANAVGGTNASRMPVMPTVSLNTIGNPAVNTVSTPSGVSGGLPNPNPNPNPNPTPTPTPTPCEDGGVENSDYTIAMCMNDLLQCVNNGALQGGINDLFNADVRNSIMSGMKLCQSVIDKCIKEVRVDCRNIYAATTDVWLDFNSRVIQPEYYNFVLRKTGLTPNQAENTCLLLDHNTYGESFAAVGLDDQVNREYQDGLYAYNSVGAGKTRKEKRDEGNKGTKTRPQGVEINWDAEYDGNRGHYARWDAAKAECLIRVAAYNKENLITTKWFFGGSEDVTAEVWQKAGSTFTCNKDLFDFKSLMNQTKNAAVIAVPGGAILGGSIGAIAGASAYNKANVQNICKDAEYRKKLGHQIKYETHKDWVLETFLYENVTVSPIEGNDNNYNVAGTEMFPNGLDYDKLTVEQCNAIHNLRSKIKMYEDVLTNCDKFLSEETTTRQIKIPQIIECQSWGACDPNTGNYSYMRHYVTDCNDTTVNETVVKLKTKCFFKPLQLGLMEESANNPLCNPDAKVCVSPERTRADIAKLKALLNEIDPGVEKKDSKGAEIAKGTAIGAVTGASAGGLATAITALVEKNNINCRVGDGLNVVPLGKSHSIDSLKDFYVKWNLKLPDTISPTAVVSDVASWQQACSQFNDRLMDCAAVSVNLKRPNSSVYELVQGACVQSGSVCIPNKSVMNSHLLTPVPVVVVVAQ